MNMHRRGLLMDNANRTNAPMTRVVRKIRRPLIAAFAATLLFVALASCTASSGGGGNSSTLSPNHVLTFAMPPGQGTAAFIFPMTGPEYFNEADDQDLYAHLWQPLYWTGSSSQSGNMSTQESLSIGNPPVYSDNNHVVTVTLKHYLWSDGQPVTCRDVEMWMNLWRADPLVNFGLTIPNVTPNIISGGNICPNPYTVQFHIEGTWNPAFITGNVLDFIVPLPQHAWDKTSANGPIGNYDQTQSGAEAVYKFLAAQGAIVSTFTTNPLWKVVDGPWLLSQMTLQGQLTFVRNPKFSGPDKPYFNKFVEEPFTSSAAEYNAILTGSVDYGALPFEDVAQLKRAEQLGYRLEPWYFYAFNALLINYANPTVGPLLKQLYIRQTLAHLVNQPQDVQAIYHGDALVDYGPIPTPAPGTHPGGIFSWENSTGVTNPYPFSTTAAANLLSSHGWHVVPNGLSTCTDGAKCGAGVKTGSTIQLTLDYPTQLPEITSEFESFQSAASQVGIKLNLRPLPIATLNVTYGPCTKNTASCWQLGSFGGTNYWYLSNDTDGGGPFEGPGATYDIPGYPSVAGANQLFQIIQESRVAPTDAAMATAMQKYEELAATDLPQIFMPVEYYQLSLIKTTLAPVTQNGLALITPELWRPAS
jgi:peptide/nickel transport system substrate-binding protein